MSNDLDDFERELWEEAQLYVDAIKRGMSQIVSELFEKIIARTPFRTGYLISQWKIGDKNTEGLRKRAKFKARTKRTSATRIGAASVALKSLQDFLATMNDPFEKIQVVNNAPYASFVRGKGQDFFLDEIELATREVDRKEYEVEVVR